MRERYKMKCKNCGKEFTATKVEHSKPYDRGDGVMYGSSNYSQNYVCPHCGTDNTPYKIF